MVLRRLGAAAVLAAGLGAFGVIAGAQDKEAFEGRDAVLRYAQAGMWKFYVSTSGRIYDMYNPLTDDILAGSEFELCDNTGGYEGTVDWVLSAGGLVQPGGNGTLPLSVTTRTANNLWQIKWTYTVDTTENELLITAAVKRLIAPNIPLAYLQVGFDFDMGHFTVSDTYDHSQHQAWQRARDNPAGAAAVWNSMTTLAMSGGKTVTTPNPYFSIYNDNNCFPPDGGLPGVGDAGSNVTYNLGAVGAGATKTVKIQLRRQ